MVHLRVDTSKTESPSLTTKGACYSMPTVHLLDYVAGNVRSLANAIQKLGYQIEWIKGPEDIENAEVRRQHPSL